MLTGSCLCGSIKYTLQLDNIETLVFCHCSRCRKETGSAFNSAAPINKTELEITEGKDLIKIYADNGVNRHFCPTCGSKLFTSRDTMPDAYRLRVGTLDSTINPIKKIHIFTGSKANWEEICDNHPQFIERMP